MGCGTHIDRVTSNREQSMSNPYDPQQAPQAPPPPPAQPQYAQQYAQPQYAHPQYVQQPYAPAPPTNTLSIFALISAFILPFVVPVVLGHISLSQIKRTGESGRGMALAGLIIGYVEIGFWAVWAFVLILIFAAAGASGAFNSSYY